MKHLIWGIDEANYFFSEDWTGKISLKMQEKLDFWRMGLRGLQDRWKRSS
jgi:hypothetical protein